MTTKPTFPEALEKVLRRPVTEAEVSRARAMIPAASRILADQLGPVPAETYPGLSMPVTLVRMVGRVIENGTALEVTDDDLRLQAANAAKLRPVHPFNRA